MAFSYKLPDGIHETENNSVIIVGANGSGKSRMGAWIEEQDGNNGNVHRISGQRDLNFPEFITLKQEERAEKELIFGSSDNNKSKGYRFGYKNNKINYTGGMLRDVENVLSLVFAKQSNQNAAFVEQCETAEQNNQPHPPLPENIIKKLTKVWDAVFPHRTIILKDNKIQVSLDAGQPYLGTEMSDGEKATLYLIAQCLAVPDGKTVIVDEPELHLHRAIMNKLWDEIEKTRKDCLFIYITHDANFVANHRNSDKIWLKGFDGTNWDFAFIQDSELPQMLLIDLLGNRQKVIFVEGTGDSHDTELYSQFYDGYYVILCGGCEKVIERTKAMRAETQLHDKECFGIIDRDFRPDTELTRLEEKGVFSLQVAEVENLFCVEGILRIVNSNQSNGDDSKVVAAIDHIKQKFETEKQGQINNATLSELKHKIAKSCENKNDLLATVNSYDTIKAEVTGRFEVLQDNDSILKVFNRKKLAGDVGAKFGFVSTDDGKEYKSLVTRLFRGDKRDEIKDALKPYLPDNTKIPY